MSTTDDSSAYLALLGVSADSPFTAFAAVDEELELAGAAVLAKRQRLRELWLTKYCEETEAELRTAPLPQARLMTLQAQVEDFLQWKLVFSQRPDLRNRTEQLQVRIREQLDFVKGVARLRDRLADVNDAGQEAEADPLGVILSLISLVQAAIDASPALLDEAGLGDWESYSEELEARLEERWRYLESVAGTDRQAFTEYLKLTDYATLSSLGIGPKEVPADYMLWMLDAGLTLKLEAFTGDPWDRMRWLADIRRNEALRQVGGKALWEAQHASVDLAAKQAQLVLDYARCLVREERTEANDPPEILGPMYVPLVTLASQYHQPDQDQPDLS